MHEPNVRVEKLDKDGIGLINLLTDEKRISPFLHTPINQHTCATYTHLHTPTYTYIHLQTPTYTYKHTPTHT